MARDHAQIRLDMWGDDDWRKLSVPAQHLYMLLLTSPSLSFCGVADWRPARIAQLAADWSTDDVLKAAAELSDRLFLVIDDETEEVLIRSFVRHDGLMKMPNMATAMATSHAGIASARLRGVVVHELRKLHEKQPDLAGWKSKRALAVLERNAIDPSVNPSGNPSVKGSVKGSDDPEPKGSPNPSVNPSPSPTPAPTPAPSTSNEVEKELTTLSDTSDGVDPFDEFWSHYPRRVAKIAARKAFGKAVKIVGADVIVAAAAKFAADPNLPGKDEEAAIPHPATWLNEGRWDDPPLPARLNRRRTAPAQARRVEIDGTHQTLWPANFAKGKTYGELKAAGYPMDDF
jgi:hypothetical protein